jgi:hypothetical protein
MLAMASVSLRVLVRRRQFPEVVWELQYLFHGLQMQMLHIMRSELITKQKVVGMRDVMHFLGIIVVTRQVRLQVAVQTTEIQSMHGFMPVTGQDVVYRETYIFLALLPQSGPPTAPALATLTHHTIGSGGSMTTQVQSITNTSVLEMGLVCHPLQQLPDQVVTHQTKWFRIPGLQLPALLTTISTLIPTIAATHALLVGQSTYRTAIVMRTTTQERQSRSKELLGTIMILVSVV